VELILTSIEPDFDGDGDVDQVDFAGLQRCLGISGVPCEPGCEYARLDEDTDVDQADAAIFLGCLIGANLPADPDCMGGY